MATAGFHGLAFDGAGPGLETGEQVLKNRLRLPMGSDLSSYWVNIGVLVGFMVAFRILSSVMIARRLIK